MVWRMACRAENSPATTMEPTVDLVRCSRIDFSLLLPVTVWASICSDLFFCKWWLNSRVAWRAAWRAQNSRATTMEPTVDRVRCRVNDFSLPVPVTVQAEICSDLVLQVVAQIARGVAHSMAR